jgi:beta-lactamase regulating signal transducer with metallopeptidase domain
MEPILYYLLKVSLGTTVFYATYFFLFRKSKGFVFNRFYLSGSFLAAFIIPLITFSTEVQLSEASTYFSESFGTRVGSAPSPATGTDNYATVAAMVFYLYVIGLLVCLGKLIVAYITAARIRRSCREERLAGMSVWIAEENNLAFTFLDKIIIGRNLLRNPSLELIVRHEAVHSHERHFYDIILAEVFSALQWFNPFARFHASAIRNNLEFRADDRVVQVSDKKVYQFTMLSMALNSIDSPLCTALNSSNLKKRMIMMNTKSKHKYTGLLRWAVIPVFTLLLVSLSGKKVVTISDKVEATESLGPPSPTLPQDASDPITATRSILRYFSENLKYPVEARKAGLIGTVRIYARVSDEGNITEVLDVRPKEAFVTFDEVVVIGYLGDDFKELTTRKSYRHQSLLAEGTRVVSSLPKLEIDSLQGKLVQFNFRFGLRSPDGRSKIWERDIDQETIDLISK